MFGLGLMLGALLTFWAGRVYQDAYRASQQAAAYVGVARERWARAVGPVVLLAAVVAVGAMFMIMS